MIGPGSDARVMVATAPVDFRKGADSLAALVKAQYVDQETVTKAEQEELVLELGDDPELEVEQVEAAEMESKIENGPTEKEPTESESSGNETSLAITGVSEAGAQSHGDAGQAPSSPNDE